MAKWQRDDRKPAPRKERPKPVIDGFRTLYGANPVLEALRSGRQVDKIWMLKGKSKVKQRLDRVLEGLSEKPPVEIIDGGALQKRCGSGEHQGIGARVAALEQNTLEKVIDRAGPNLFVLVLDGIEDPHNLGAIYRLADATGVDLVVVAERGAASPQLASVAKSSAGAVEHVATSVVPNLQDVVTDLHERGFSVFCLEAYKSAKLPWECALSRPLALILGSEGRGVSHSLARLADGVVSLPMGGKVASLNVSTAAAMVMYEVQRQHAMK